MQTKRDHSKQKQKLLGYLLKPRREPIDAATENFNLGINSEIQEALSRLPTLSGLRTGAEV